MIYSVDRIEGEYAVLTDENGGSEDVKVGELERCPREGDVLEKREGGFVFREDLTKQRKERMIGRTRKMFE